MVPQHIQYDLLGYDDMPWVTLLCLVHDLFGHIDFSLVTLLCLVHDLGV